jgi:hypothetical protein
MYDNPGLAFQAPTCSICNRTVSLSDAKTDEDGKAVHENCYLLKLGVGETIGRDAKTARDVLIKDRQLKHW